MADGTGGILVDDVEGCANALIALLTDEHRARALGANGRERIRRHFLIPRLVLDELSLMQRLASGAPAGRAFEWVSHRDPVCGMAVETADETALLDGLTLRFCSAQCRKAFAAAPERYLGGTSPPPRPLPSAGTMAPAY